MRYEASVERANSVLNFIKNNTRSSTGSTIEFFVFIRT